MRLNSVLYVFTSAWSGFWRNGLMSAAAVASVSVMLVMLGGFLILVSSLNLAIEGLESRMDIQAFLTDNAEPSQILTLEAKLRRMDDVKQVNFISKDDAMTRLRQQLADRPDLLDAMVGNPLPASLEVRVGDPRRLATVASTLEDEKLVSDVVFKRDTVGRLLKLTTFLRRGGLAATLLMGLISLFVIVNTVRVAVFSRRDEIEIMQLVGAGDWFVRLPYILEGMLAGLLGGVVSALVMSLAYRPVVDQLRSLVSFLPLALNPHFLTTLVVSVIALGVVIGARG